MQASDLKVKLFVDSGDIEQMRHWIGSGVCQGATSNPSLAKKAGVLDYLAFCKDAAMACGSLPISLEVVADAPDEIIRQARILAGIGKNVCVKVPIVDSRGASNLLAIETLAREHIQLNVTACFTSEHVQQALDVLRGDMTWHYISVFAGRIADAGVDPTNLMRAAAWATKNARVRLIWASIRAPYDIISANDCGVDVITAFPEMLRKVHLFGKDLDEFAAETSAMFYQDALAAGYIL